MIRGCYPFELAEGLAFLPLAARRALDHAGLRLSLEGFRSLSEADREALCMLGEASSVEVARVRSLIAGASPAASASEAVADPAATEPPGALVEALGASRPLSAITWQRLRPLDRYALVKLSQSKRRERLDEGYAHIVQGGSLTHLNARGEASMVDVGKKAPTERRAVATSLVQMKPETVALIVRGDAAKGDVLAAARIAGIMAAKRTPDLIPLCHGIALTRVEIDFALDREAGTVLVSATAEANDRTGVEMEAMVAASVAALTLYDMLKAVDRWMVIASTRLEEKTGGKSGPQKREVSS